MSFHISGLELDAKWIWVLEAKRVKEWAFCYNCEFRQKLSYFTIHGDLTSFYSSSLELKELTYSSQWFWGKKVTYTLVRQVQRAHNPTKCAIRPRSIYARCAASFQHRFPWDLQWPFPGCTNVFLACSISKTWKILLVHVFTVDQPQRVHCAKRYIPNYHFYVVLLQTFLLDHNCARQWACLRRLIGPWRNPKMQIKLSMRLICEWYILFFSLHF